MALDGPDLYCLGFTTTVVLTILLLLVIDPGDGMRKARQKVEARRAAAAAAAAAGGDGHRGATRSMGTRGGKAPSWLQRHLGEGLQLPRRLSSAWREGDVQLRHIGTCHTARVLDGAGHVGRARACVGGVQG